MKIIKMPKLKIKNHQVFKLNLIQLPTPAKIRNMLENKLIWVESNLGQHLLCLSSSLHKD